MTEYVESRETTGDAAPESAPTVPASTPPPQPTPDRSQPTTPAPVPGEPIGDPLEAYEPLFRADPTLLPHLEQTISKSPHVIAQTIQAADAFAHSALTLEERLYISEKGLGGDGRFLSSLARLGKEYAGMRGTIDTLIRENQRLQAQAAGQPIRVEQPRAPTTPTTGAAATTQWQSFEAQIEQKEQEIRELPAESKHRRKELEDERLDLIRQLSEAQHGPDTWPRRVTYRR